MVHRILREKMNPKLAFKLPLIAWFLTAPLLAAPRNSSQEIEMWKLVNNDRAEHGLKPLALDAKISETARKHSRDMGKSNFFGHVSPKTGSMSDRLYRDGIACVKSAENVALHKTIASAQKGLMESPGHRKNLLDPAFTHIGIGIVKDSKGMLLVTQNFAKPIPEFDTEKTEDEFLEVVNLIRKSKEFGPLKKDDSLTGLCQKNSDNMNKIGKLDISTVKRRLRNLPFKSYKLYYFFCESPTRLLETKDLFNPTLTHLGLGIARNEKRKKGFGMLWVTLVLAR